MGSPTRWRRGPGEKRPRSVEVGELAPGPGAYSGGRGVAIKRTPSSPIPMATAVAQKAIPPPGNAERFRVPDGPPGRGQDLGRGEAARQVRVPIRAAAA